MAQETVSYYRDLDYEYQILVAERNRDKKKLHKEMREMPKNLMMRRRVKVFKAKMKKRTMKASMIGKELADKDKNQEMKRDKRVMEMKMMDQIIKTTMMMVQMVVL